jgi:hypothetical protein
MNTINIIFVININTSPSIHPPPPPSTLTPPNLPSPNRRTRSSITLKIVININLNSRIRSFIRAREFHTRGVRSPGSGHGYLITGHVELGAADAGRGVQGDGFSADEVVSWSEGGGDDYGTFAAVGVERVLEIVLARSFEILG